MYLASCSLGNHLYAICGYGTEVEDGKKDHLNTIESLERPGEADPDDIPEWEQMNVEDHILEPRNSPVVCPINTQEIIICGGYCQNSEMWLGDMILFNCRTGQIKKVVESDGRYCFSAYDN